MKKPSYRADKTMTNFRLLPLSAISLALAVSGCATPVNVPKKLEYERSPLTESASVLGEERAQRKYSETDTPGVSNFRSSNIKNNEAPQTSAIGGDEKDDLAVSFNQMPIPTFVHAIYGGVLKVSYSMDPAVASRTDLVTFRTPKPQSAKQMAHLARMLLKSYGIAVQDFGGVIRIVPDSASNSYSPLIKRGRAQPDTPASLRPVFHYIELEAVRVADFSAFLRTMFGAKISFTEDAPHNALLISGQPEDVSAAMEVVQVFDQPAMRGQRSKRITPVFWTAEEFARRLNDILTAEGYAVGQNATAGTPIILLPIGPLNSVVVFSSSDEIMTHVLKWSRELDRPSESRVGGTFFTYPVKYADAQSLAKTLSELISPGSTAPAVTAPTAPGAAPAPAPARSSGGIVVNTATNSLIIKGGTADDYRQWMTLLAELDKPTKSALVEVTVAEVSLKASKSLGVNWGFRDGTTRPAGVNGVITSGSAGGSGLTVNFLNAAGLVRAQLNALASDNQARILSSPKIMARNGEVATIQVGDEVPILTSTTTTVGGITAPGGSASNVVTNSVQYRSTGVVLRVRPVINSGNRIDLDITQEVSSPAATTTGVTDTPTISTRKVDTKLSLRDGSTIMLAGLIQNIGSRGDSGVPFLKDIPAVGNLFKQTNDNDNRTELIIMITPYIINDDFEAESITGAFQNTLGDWAKDLRERTEAGRLKRPDAASTAPKADAQKKPVPSKPTSAQAAEKEEKAPPVPQKTVPKESAPKTSPATPAEKSADDSSGVIMSKPTIPPPTSAVPAKTPGAKSTTKPNTPSSAGKTPPGSAPGKPVEDQNLLEELRRAVEKR